MTPAKGFAEMKDSGIEWIGEIPAHWNLTRLQSQLYEINEINNPVKTTQVLSLTNKLGVIPYEEKGNQGNKAKEDFTGCKIAYPICIVANSMNILIGSVGLSQYYGCVSPVYYVFRAKDSANIKFLNYLFSLPSFQKELRKYANGILEIRLRVSSGNILRRKIALPPPNEQATIVSYLDAQCAKIDEIIAQGKASIEDYKQWKASIIQKAVTKGMGNNRPMKDSGILWIKKIPESWSVRKLKFAIFPLERPVLNTDEVITCFRDGEVTLRKNRRTDGFTVSFTEHGYQGVEKGDLVIHGMDAFAGAIGCSDCRGKTTPVVHVCKTIGNNRYFMYALRNMALSNVFTDFSNGVRIRSSDFRNFSKLGDFLIAIPPITEQDEIVDYLDNMTSKIDMLITEKQRLLDEMESYKKSLIYEVVTGKRRVC